MSSSTFFSCKNWHICKLYLILQDKEIYILKVKHLINMTDSKTVTITREEAMKRFMEAKRKKQQRVAELEARLREK